MAKWHQASRKSSASYQQRDIGVMAMASLGGVSIRRKRKVSKACADEENVAVSQSMAGVSAGDSAAGGGAGCERRGEISGGGVSIVTAVVVNSGNVSTNNERK
jgi:hypothetical protein